MGIADGLLIHGGRLCDARAARASTGSVAALQPSQRAGGRDHGARARRASRPLGGVRASRHGQREHGRAGPPDHGRSGGPRLLEDTTTERAPLLWEVLIGLGHGYADIHAAYTEREPNGFPCERDVSERIRGKDRAFFPGDCRRAVSEPRSVHAGCGDGPTITSVDWKRWTKDRTTASGVAHSGGADQAAKLVASQPQRCRRTQRYQYTRLTVRYGAVSQRYELKPCARRY